MATARGRKTEIKPIYIMKKSTYLLVALFILTSLFSGCKKCEIYQPWSNEQAKVWYGSHPYCAGCNFQPSTAINQIEMWQSSTFDAATIDRELGWAEELGFNLMRVYLSSVVWQNEPEAFKAHIDEYLTIAESHGIKTLFVFFDDCWNPESAYGEQPAPQSGIHNSGWVQDPAVSLRADTITLFPILERYVKDVMTTFKNDERIWMWDLYNEPGNSGHKMTSLPLLRNVFRWARECQVSQPLTVGVWFMECPELNQFQLTNSDIISYHNYSNLDIHRECIDSLRKYDRPLVCTEYMARRNGSNFQTILPLLRENNVAAINWGFVSGKTNTIFAWDEPMPEVQEPPLWFHDIFRQDHTPFCQEEIDTIKSIMKLENK